MSATIQTAATYTYDEYRYRCRRVERQPLSMRDWLARYAEMNRLGAEAVDTLRANTCRLSDTPQYARIQALEKELLL